MTSLVRRAAGGLTVVEAAWLLYSYYDTLGTLIGCPFNGGSCIGIPRAPLTALGITFVLALLLLIAGVLGIWGVSIAYSAGSVLSAVALLWMGLAASATRSYGYLSTATNDALLAVAFSLVALIVNFQAVRSESELSEQANPMNLPVFG